MRHLHKSTEKDFITFDNESESENNNSNNSNNSNKKFEDFSEVEKKLNEILSKNTNKNKELYSDIPIRITLNSYNCIDGIIIDLPGFPEKGKKKHKKNLINFNKI